jgi:hypothetical protein
MLDLAGNGHSADNGTLASDVTRWPALAQRVQAKFSKVRPGGQ